MAEAQTRTGRIADIGKRANALRRAGFYSTEEVEWLADYLRGEVALLIEVELLMANAEQIVAASTS